MKYILIAVDYTTRFVVVRAARTADGKAMQKFLKECIIQRYGWMKRLTTDQGTPFRSRLSQEFFKKYRIEHRMTNSYHQQADGLAELANKTVMIMVRQHLEPLAKQKDWPDLLQSHVMAYNTSKQASMGYEPFFLMHGFHAATGGNSPSDANSNCWRRTGKREP